MKAEIKHSDLNAIQQILLDAMAVNIQEDRRFWDGYAMCLNNLSLALITRIEVDKPTS